VSLTRCEDTRRIRQLNVLCPFRAVVIIDETRLCARCARAYRMWAHHNDVPISRTRRIK